MKYRYTTTGTCSRAIDIDVVDGVINEVQFIGGCAGNTSGVAALLRGMKITEAADRLRGIRCGAKPTSCPDQLAAALDAIASQTPTPLD